MVAGRAFRERAAVALAAGALMAACSYRLLPGPLAPLDEAAQGEGVTVADNGAVAHHIGRLRVSLKPMTDQELNRQLTRDSQGESASTNPYTYGDWKPRGALHTPQRFTVFLLQVENYEYPKVLVDPHKVQIRAGNRRRYESLSFEVLREYFYPYNVAYAGIQGQGFRERTDLLKHTLYPAADPLFAGQSKEGFLVFQPLHDDVTDVTVTIDDVVLRFDYKDDAVEQRSLTYRFQRQVARLEAGDMAQTGERW